MSFYLSVRCHICHWASRQWCDRCPRSMGRMTRLWMIIATNVRLLPLNALRVVEMIWKVTSIVATCYVSLSKVYQTTWNLWDRQREANCNRSLTFNNGSGHVIVLLHNGWSSLPLKTSQGSVSTPTPQPSGQRETGLFQPEEELLFISMTGRIHQVYLPQGEGTCESTGKWHKCLIPHRVTWESPNQWKVYIYTLEEMQLWCFFNTYSNFN